MLNLKKINIALIQYLSELCIKLWINNYVLLYC